MEFDYEKELLLNLRNRIDVLSLEQKNQMRLLVEFHNEGKNTYNRNGIFINMTDLTDDALDDIKQLLTLYEATAKFVKKFYKEPLSDY